jgi:Ceramidase
MTFGERVFLYCERGTNEALLAEPFNALSNGAFLLSALAGFFLVLRRPRDERNADQFLLPVLVLFIGLGSLAFHVYANSAAALADVVPISVFMLVYLGLALNRFLGIPPGWTTLLVAGFAAIVAITMQVRCGEGFIGFPGADTAGVKPCLNGSLFYLPALAALIVVGLTLAERGHKAAPWLLWAAAIFAVSIALRSLDLALCDKVVVEGRKVGTHAAWHVLNALTLFLLMRASLEGGPSTVMRTEMPPLSDELAEPAIEKPAGFVPADVPTSESAGPRNEKPEGFIPVEPPSERPVEIIAAEPPPSEPAELSPEEKPDGFIPPEPRSDKPSGFIPAELEPEPAPAPKPLSERVASAAPSEAEDAETKDDKEETGVTEEIKAQDEKGKRKRKLVFPT